MNKQILFSILAGTLVMGAIWGIEWAAASFVFWFVTYGGIAWLSDSDGDEFL